MAVNVVTCVAVTILLTFCYSSAAKLSKVERKRVLTKDGPVQDLKESDSNCTFQRETTSHNSGQGTVVRDFKSRLILVKYSSTEGVCYVRFMTKEELKNRCSGQVVNSTDDPTAENEVRYEVVDDIDVESLPLEITQGNNCTSAKLMRPVTSRPAKQGNRHRRQSVSTPAPGMCARYILYYTTCKKIEGSCDPVTNMCKWLCTTYAIPFIYCNTATTTRSPLIG